MLLVGSTLIWDTGTDAWRTYTRYYRRPSERAGISGSIPGYGDEQTVAFHIRDRTRPNESMYVWGFDPAMYLLAGRPSASRFLLSFPLMSDWAPPRRRSEFIQKLKASRPSYIVVQRGQPGNWIVGHDVDLAEYVDQFPEFRQFLESGYDREDHLVGNEIFRRRVTGSGG